MANGVARDAEEINPDLTTKGKVRVLRGRNLSVREIAAELDITTQAVHYHLKAIREEAEQEAAS